MTFLYLALAGIAALAFYLATAHQQLWPAVRARARLVRGMAWIVAALAAWAAITAAGVWAGVFAALTAFMATAVALPWLDNARRLRRERRHVG